MSLELTNKDYVNILKFYKMTIPKSKRLLKMNAEKILNDKLCRCIKKLETNKDINAISVCTGAVINRKNLKRGRYTCKKKRMIKLSKNGKTRKSSKH